MLPVLVAAAAFAQSPSITVDPGAAFTGQPGTFTANGVGAPSVAWDPVQERYIMAFETQTGAADATCPEGYWSIGLATSEDGLTQWELWPDPVVEPTPGAPWSCYAVHPALVRDDDGVYHLWFKAGQATDACAGDAPAWGCAVQPGIGKVSGTIELDDNSDDIAAVQAELALIEQAIAQVLATVEAETASFLAALTSSTALECVDYDDICSPCHTFRLEATHTPGGGSVFTQKDLCQVFDFVVPGEIDVSAGSAGQGSNKAYLRFTGQWSQAECTYKGTANNPGAPYEQQIGGGKCAIPHNAYFVEMEVEGSSPQHAPTTAFVDLVATNVQTWQGPGYDTLVALAAAAAAGDEAAFLDAQDALVVLGDLRVVLAGLPGVDAAALDLAAGDLATVLTQALIDFDALDADRQVLLDELAQLQAYTRAVELDGPTALSLTEPRAAYPTVVKVGDTWHMQVQVKRHLRSAASADGVTFAFTGHDIAANQAPWARTELLTPALTCGGAGPDAFRTLLVGRETVSNIPGNNVIQGAVGDATSADFVSWLFNAVPWVNGGFVSNTSWRHLDALRDGSGYRIWLSEISGAGQSVIRTASVGVVGTSGGEGRVCP